MPDDYKISDLTTAGAITNSDLVEVSTVNPSSPSGYSSVKATMTQLGNKLANDLQYSADLQTTAKTLVGAINEVASGSSIDMPVKSATGNPCTFETDLADNLVSLTAEIVASGGGGTPSTPIPIVGYSSANIVNTQNESIVELYSIDSDFRGTVDFNQLFTATSSGTYDSILTTFDSATGTLHSSGTTASTYYFFVTGAEHKIPITSGHKYFVHIDDTRTVRYAVYDGGTNRNIVDKIGATIINSTYNGWLSLVSMNNTVGASVDITCKPNVIDLTAMFGSTIADYIYSLEQNNAGAGVAFFRSIYPDDYYAYDSGTTEIVGKETPYTVAFGQTVYGGVLDVTRGKLHVTWGSVDLGDLTWLAYGGTASYDRYVSSGIDSLAKTDGHTLCEAFGTTRFAVNSCWLGGGNSKLSATTTVGAYADATAFKTAMSGIILAYELATPFDIDLTPVQISALVGTNNITSDLGGDVEVEYVDGQLAQSISKMIEANPTWKEITGTLTAGNTSIMLSDASITTESTIDVYTDTFGVNPTAVSVSAGAVTLTFTAQSSNVKVKVRIT